MTSDQFLLTLLLTASGYAALLWTRLRDAREARDCARAEANLANAHWDAQRAKAERLADDLIAAHLLVEIANGRQKAAANYAADMQAQRDAMQRRLAQATWPEGAHHG